MRPFLKISLFILISSEILASGLRLPYSAAYLKHHPNHCGFIEFTSHASMAMTLIGEHKARNPFPEPGSAPHFYVVAEGGQNQLRGRDLILEIKTEMLEGSFEYEAFDARIGGTYDGRKATYIISEGRHRLNAALEIAHEKGDWKPFVTLINLGRWDLGVTPKDSRSLNFRDSSAPIKEIYLTLQKITPPKFMPSENSIIRFFQNK